MGDFLSNLGSVFSGLARPPEAPPPVVLVPPMFQRDVQDMSRFARSSYDTLASRRALSRLLHDHLAPEPSGALLLSPPGDPRVSVRAALRQGGGSMVLRWQPSDAGTSVHTFLEMAASLERPGDVCMRGSWLHEASGVGAFATAPLAKHISGEAAQVGLRYSSPSATAGLIVTPREGAVSQAWMAARVSNLTLGWQLSPSLPLSSLLPPLQPQAITTPTASTTPPASLPAPSSQQPTPAPAAAATSLQGPDTSVGAVRSLSELLPWLRSRSSLLLAYSPPPPPPSATASSATVVQPFTASVEMVDGRRLVFSFLQHIALTRQVVNPFEEEGVVGITNYVDVGLQLTTAIGGTAPEGPGAKGDGGGGGGGAAAERPGVNLAASWQINKNWMVKARVGSDSAAAAVGLRLWHAVSAYATACVHLDYATRTPRYGGELVVENFGPLRYERGADDVAAGRALLQRHEASDQDLANFAGQGVLVRRTAGAGHQTADPGSQEAKRARAASLM